MSKWIFCKGKMKKDLQSVVGTDYYYHFNQGTKFVDDKVVIDDDELFLILDGIIFNKNTLKDKYNNKSWKNIIKILYNMYGIGFVKEIKGSYNGLILDKSNEKVYSFVDPLGVKPVFYYNKRCLLATDFCEILNIIKKNNIKYSVDKEAIRRLLFFGYMVDNRTCMNEIKRVFPGNYIIHQDSTSEEICYFRFNNKNLINESEDNLIDLIDEKFTSALKLQFDKDEEYGYEHLVDISGGLDARAVNFVAKKMGYKNITNICYSQMNAYEKSITEDLVRRLENDYLFKALDNVSFLYKVDDIVKENYGLCYYAGITGGRDLLRILDKTQFGIEHTGLLGDVYEGSFSEKAVYEKPKIEKKYRVSSLLNIELDKSFLNQYSENEIFLFYTRGLLAGTSTHLIRDKYFDTFTPFGDIDFLELMFSIPLEQRIDNQIYLKWLKKKYPDAMKELYAKTMCYPTSGKLRIKIRVLWNIMLLKIILPLKKNLKFNSKWNYKGTMNPMDYWYETKPELKKFVKQYYEENIKLVEDLEIKNYLMEMYEHGNMTDKEVMLTVLSIYKQFIVNNE